ncbi:hypothetical protein [Chelativorans sp. AA-79]|uniref:hypothetical protein n=1 Tax=Chelativorans sp. AA-79 TaxID=3028735 RepID=UPI0023F7D4F3|nr:hypothetical protein [Chelativorans sp. AA-79]WEX11685.1 hypothetical protein PVE73_12535 [Chelativorans sp. AA-79]
MGITSPHSADAAQHLLDSNAKVRARFLADWPCLTIKRVPNSVADRSTDRSTTSRWKDNGKIFSVRYNDTEYFPAFQFHDGQPHGTVARVLKILSKRKSEWQIAFWFTSPNGWLDGKKPAECLNEIETVASAAAEEAEPIVG